MTFLVRSCLRAGVAVVLASAVVVVSSVRPPAPDLVASPAIRLSVAVQPLTTQSDNIPSLADEIGMGIVPSLGAPLPTPPSLGPSPAPTDFNSLIKNTYLAIEPWVQYGFELVTWGVGWIPWVGWLAPQIMIFYFFGERIAHSDVWNLDDWLWGSLPFVQGYVNNAVDKWNALVQLGIDEWNFWLPNLPLPPLPLAAQQTTTLAALTATTSPTTPPPAGPTTLKGTLQQSQKRLAGVTSAAASSATQSLPQGAADPSPPQIAASAKDLSVGPTLKSVVKTPSIDSKGGTQAQGEVRGGTSTATTSTATMTDSPKPQVTKPATGLSDTLTRDSLKLANDQVTTAPATAQGGPAHHADDKTPTVATGTANGGKPLPATHTELKKK